MQEGQALFELLMSKRGDDPALANKLLSAMHRGFPVTELGPLLENDDPKIVLTGAWLQSELGQVGRPLVGYLPRLLQNEQKHVRAYALDSLTACAMENDGPIVAAATQLVKDPERAVRWKTIVTFLKGVATRALQAGAACEDDEELRYGLSSIGGEGHTQSLLESGSPVLRRFGLASALRHGEEAALRLAAASADDEIAEFAVERLALREASARRHGHK